MPAKTILTALLPGVIDRVIKSKKSSAAAVAVAAAATQTDVVLTAGSLEEIITQIVMGIIALVLLYRKDAS
jgi:hypothetical protein